MNPAIQQLYNIAQKNEKKIIGLMSGTSLDGLDIALCRFNGNGLHTKVEVEKFETVNYSKEFKNDILSVFSKKEVSLEKVCLLNAQIGITHANMINECLAKWNITTESIDIIASHGQTIYHAPKSLHKQSKFPNATLQIGDGDHIAVNTGIITLSDFRQKHIAAGGEGAPLAVYGDYLLFGKKGENRVLLNIGGISNFTFLSASMQLNEVFSTDVGPGNTLMDAYIKKEFTPLTFDTNAQIAKQGNINRGLLDTLKKHSFFSENIPKTTGPELFNLTYLENALQASNTINISSYDIMATLNRFTAEVIADSLCTTISTKDYSVFVSGGGMHNDLLLQNLKQLLPSIVINTTEQLNIHPDAKESVLFATLANECLSNNITKSTSFNKNFPEISMGKISLPY